MACYVTKYCVAAIPLLLSLTPGVRAQLSGVYQLDTEYSGASFYDGFEFFNGPDPTNGFVTYVDQATASSLGLTNILPNGASYMGVDHTTTLDPNGPGRKSVRISTKKTFTHGLFIADISHMPFGCGTWPAFWMFGPNWPSSGEIDIIEGVNSQQFNMMTLHSSAGCLKGDSNQLGTTKQVDCDANVNYNSGCGVQASTSASYGPGFNTAGGGVFATEWTSDHIRVWFFPRGAIPSDISGGSPDPTTWGTPQANFDNGCNIDNYFKDHQIVFDTTFCGDWGNAVWSSDGVCGGLAPTCSEYVAGTPGAFEDASWEVNYLKVYQRGAGETSVAISVDSSPVDIPAAANPAPSGEPVEVPVAVVIENTVTKTAGDAAVVLFPTGSNELSNPSPPVESVPQPTPNDNTAIQITNAENPSSPPPPAPSGPALEETALAPVAPNPNSSSSQPISGDPALPDASLIFNGQPVNDLSTLDALAEKYGIDLDAVLASISAAAAAAAPTPQTNPPAAGSIFYASEGGSAGAAAPDINAAVKAVVNVATQVVADVQTRVVVSVQTRTVVPLPANIKFAKVGRATANDSRSTNWTAETEQDMDRWLYASGAVVAAGLWQGVQTVILVLALAFVLL